MHKYRHNMFVRLGELGRPRLAVMLALGVAAAIAAAVVGTADPVHQRPPERRVLAWD